MSNHKNLILFGPPGVGKGTQAKLLGSNLNLPHIDTGGLIRQAIINETDLGKQAKSFVESGKLVPDELIIELIREKLNFLEQQSIRGFILDGFPRTIPQAEALEKMIEEFDEKINWVISIKAPKEVVVSRLSSRRMCSKKTCHEIYNLITKPPKEENKCDICGNELYQRADDSVEACVERFIEYDTKTAPLEEYYRKKGLLTNIDGIKAPGDVYNEILSVIN